MSTALHHDLRYALRALTRHPGLTAAAVLTLALAIGANTAVFSLVYGVLLRPLPYHEPDRLVSLWQRSLDGSASRVPVAPGNFDDWRRQARSFESMSAWAVGVWTVKINGEPENLNGIISIGSPFDVLGTSPPLLGRTYTAEEADRDERVAVLSYDVWQRLFGGDPLVIGKTVEIDGLDLEVVGVMARGFRYLDAKIEIWTPVPWELIAPMDILEGVDSFRTSRDQRIFVVGARLADGVTREEAESEMETLMARLREEYPRANAEQGAAVVPLHQLMTGAVQPRLRLLMGAVLLVLVIGCVNLASLLLGRASARHREMAIRQSLGSGRFRLVRQLLTESVVLAATGGLAGLLVGALLLKTILRFFPWQLPRAHEIALDGPVLLFTLGLSVLVGLLFGVLPSLSLSRRSSLAALRHAGLQPRRGLSTLKALMIGELALAMVLIHGEGLLLRSFNALVNVAPGFRDEGLLTLVVGAADMETSQARLAFFEEVGERVAAVPGVEAVTMANELPLAGFQPPSRFHILEKPQAEGEAPYRVAYTVVSPGYFEVMEIPLLRGRVLTASDRRDSSPAVVVNAAFAERYLAEEGPLGKRLVLGPPDQPRMPPSTIVGVVGDVRASALSTAPGPRVYVPQAVIPSFAEAALIFRPSIDGVAGLAASVRTAVRAVDGDAPISQIRPIEEILSAQLAPSRSMATLLGMFTGLALALAALGVFGVISYSVSRRWKEFGIRMALGADRRSILRLVLGQGGILAALGLACGALGAMAFSRVLEGQLYDVSPRDPVTLLAVAAVLAAVAACAVYLPAQRVTRLDPARVLHDE